MFEEIDTTGGDEYYDLFIIAVMLTFTPGTRISFASRDGVYAAKALVGAREFRFGTTREALESKENIDEEVLSKQISASVAAMMQDPRII